MDVLAGSAKIFAPPSARPRYARRRTYDVVHIKLELQLDPKRRDLRGMATLRFSPINDGFRHLDLDLAANLHVRAVHGVGRKRLDFEHAGDRLRVDLGREHVAGRELEVSVSYAGVPQRGLYFVGPDTAFPDKPHEIWSQGQDEDSRYWFPCYDDPNDKATSEIVATVPRPFSVISNGKLLSVTENSRRSTRSFHWREDFPHPAYLISIVVGDYVEVRDEADGVPVSYWVHGGDAEKVRRTFGNTPEMLRFFSRCLDYPYPYEKYAQVVVTDFIFGGMENISATTLTDAVLLDATAALDTHSDSLLAHELAHQWWGNLLTCKEWSHAWLNEGFATYFDALFAEHQRGRDEFFWQIHEDAQEYFREDEEKYRRPIVERHWSKPIEIFDRHLYEKGALVVHMLRHELGEDLFWKAMRHYVRKHQFQNVETADLKIAIEEATGRHLDGFFDQWVHAPGFPVLEVSWSWNDGTGLVGLRVKQTQDRDHGSPLYSLPLDIEIATAAGRERHRVQVDSAEQTLYLQSRKRPLWLRVDPEHHLLKKLQYEQSRSELLAQLRGTSDLFGQVDAAEGLARFLGDREVLQALGAVLGKPRFHAVKSAVARALGRIGGDEARDLLIAALDERDLRARRGVVKSLAEFKDDAAAAAALRRAWKREKSYFVRAEILAAAGKIGAPGAFEFLGEGLRVPAFRDVIRAAALRAMGQLEDARGIGPCLEWAQYGHGRWTREAAMKTLAALGRVHPERGREVQDALEKYLRDPSFFGSLAAADALGKLGRAQAVPALHRLQRAEVDGRLQKAAREAIEALESAAHDPEAWKSVRTEMRQLQMENRELRERLDGLEARFGGDADGTRPRPRRAKHEPGTRRRAKQA